MKITIINGPNLNLLGIREPEIYGTTTFENYLQELRDRFPNIEFYYFQSNIEGELINMLQQALASSNAVIINPAGYTHTSVSLADTIAAMQIPVIEVHISNIFARETYRQQSLTGAKAKGCISGLGLEGYALATAYLESILKNN